VPHLTLARFKRAGPDNHSRSNRTGSEPLQSAAAKMAERDFGSARETEFHLFESITKPGGSEYLKLATYSFVKGSQ
jgi:2'-5' RNA ligase